MKNTASRFSAQEKPIGRLGYFISRRGSEGSMTSDSGPSPSHLVLYGQCSVTVCIVSFLLRNQHKEERK